MRMKKEVTKQFSKWNDELNHTRLKLTKGDKVTQNYIYKLVKKWEKRKEFLRPFEKEELFPLVDFHGNLKSLEAPRWLCHLFSLRHRSVYILLQWQSLKLGKVFIFQIRNWKKSDTAGHLDFSVGGHVKKGPSLDPKQTVLSEMQEELGITLNDLKGKELKFYTGYESYNKCIEENFYNAEWQDIYLGEINTKSFDKICFKDKEVVGIYLCPQLEVKNLITQKIIPISYALKNFLSLS